jgi:hypothetical protein
MLVLSLDLNFLEKNQQIMIICILSIQNGLYFVNIAKQEIFFLAKNDNYACVSHYLLGLQSRQEEAR